MKPAIIEAEVDIDRSPADVFDYCSDHRHEPEWNPMMKRIAAGAHLAMWMEVQLHGVLRLAAPLLRRRLRSQFERDVRNIKVILEKTGS